MSEQEVSNVVDLAEYRRKQADKMQKDNIFKMPAVEWNKLMQANRDKKRREEEERKKKNAQVKNSFNLNKPFR